MHQFLQAEYLTKMGMTKLMPPATQPHCKPTFISSKPQQLVTRTTGMPIPAPAPAAPQHQHPPASPPSWCGVSPFLAAPQMLSATASPVVVRLKRDQHQAITLCPSATLQTRFGNFPHASFIGLPPGSQVRASESFPTQREQRKRKRQSAVAAAAAAGAAAGAAADAGAEAATDIVTPGTTTESEPGTAVTVTATGSTAASSGFVHVLAPTPELWTASLPHRTQVVYTPDSSYILHRLGVVPGTQIIEAGAGSGSFTHAAGRAVYNGYPDGRDGLGLSPGGVALGAGEAQAKKGKVWSFEFHEERAGKLRQEIAHHGLDPLVTVTHKDVCADGFLVPPLANAAAGVGADAEPASPCATAVFLDLPAPWLALRHLSRCAPSALDPLAETRICTFSPCIEQVTRTCAAMRAQGWVDIATVELAHQHVEVRRQLPRGYDEGAGPRNIAEALARLKGVNEFRELRRDIQASLSAGQPASFAELGFAAAASNGAVGSNGGGGGGNGGGGRGRRQPETAGAGRLLTRNEPELKTHTSFLTFATLPRQWTADQEEVAAQWVRERDSQGPAATPRVVGEKAKRWKGEAAESKTARKKRERAEREAAKGQHRDGGEGVAADLAVQQEQGPGQRQGKGEQEQEQGQEQEEKEQEQGQQSADMDID